MPVLLVFAAFLAPLFRRVFGTLFGSLALGAGAGFVVWLVSSVLFASVLVGGMVFVFALAGIGGGAGRWASRGPFGGMPGGFGGGFGGGGGGGFQRRRRSLRRRRCVGRLVAMRVVPHLLLPRVVLNRRFPAATLTGHRRRDRRVGEAASRRDPARGRGRARRARAVARAHGARPRARGVRRARRVGHGRAQRRTDLRASGRAPRRDRGRPRSDGSCQRRRMAAGVRVDRAEFAASRWRDGALHGIEAATALLEREFPAGGANRNEQPNRPIVL